jgi:hypothetical protein
MCAVPTALLIFLLCVPSAYESVSRLEFRRFFLGLEMAGPLLMAHFSFPVPELLAFGFYALRRRLR